MDPEPSPTNPNTYPRLPFSSQPHDVAVFNSQIFDRSAVFSEKTVYSGKHQIVSVMAHLTIPHGITLAIQGTSKIFDRDPAIICYLIARLPLPAKKVP